MKKSLYNEVLAIARRNITKHREYGHFLHYSFIIQGNQIVEWGTNNKRVPAIHNGYHDRIRDLDFSPKTHSEVDAWKKASGILDNRRSFQMINIRLNKAGEIRNSKPCECCFEILKAMGCSKFYYSSSVGFLSC